jgi:hypothetical protein
MDSFNQRLLEGCVTVAKITDEGSEEQEGLCVFRRLTKEEEGRFQTTCVIKPAGNLVSNGRLPHASFPEEYKHPRGRGVSDPRRDLVQESRASTQKAAFARIEPRAVSIRDFIKKPIGIYRSTR